MWTLEDVQILQSNYKKLGVQGCAKLLGCSTNRIRRKAQLLNLSSDLAKKSWTEKDIKFLSNNYHTLGSSKCAEILERSPTAVRSKASRIYLSEFNDWTEEDIGFLKEIYPSEGSIVVAKALNRTSKAVIKKASEFGIKTEYSTQGYSKIAIEWLNSLKISGLLHAEHGGEVRIGKYYVDGFDPTTKDIYEFHGDVFHGNPKKFKDQDFPNPFDKRKSAKELWDKTKYRMQALKDKGHNVFYIWESDYKQGKQYERF